MTINTDWIYSLGFCDEVHELISDYDLTADTADLVYEIMEEYDVDPEVAIEMEESE